MLYIILLFVFVVVYLMMLMRRQKEKMSEIKIQIDQLQAQHDRLQKERDQLQERIIIWKSNENTCKCKQTRHFGVLMKSRKFTMRYGIMLIPFTFTLR